MQFCFISDNKFDKRKFGTIRKSILALPVLLAACVQAESDMNDVPPYAFYGCIGYFDAFAERAETPGDQAAFEKVSQSFFDAGVASGIHKGEMRKMKQQAHAELRRGDYLDSSTFATEAIMMRNDCIIMAKKFPQTRKAIRETGIRSIRMPG